MNTQAISRYSASIATDSVELNPLSFSEGLAQIKTDTNKSRTEEESQLLQFSRYTNRKSSIKEEEVNWWLGKVIEVFDDYFAAHLEDLNGLHNIVEFDLDEINAYEQSLITVGARFTYAITSYFDPSTYPGGKYYRTKIAFHAPQRWLAANELKAKKVAEDIFPEELFSF